MMRSPGIIRLIERFSRCLPGHFLNGQHPAQAGRRHSKPVNGEDDEKSQTRHHPSSSGRRGAAKGISRWFTDRDLITALVVLLKFGVRPEDAFTIRSKQVPRNRHGYGYRCSSMYQLTFFAARSHV
jgi:hypothetical protein